jgi:hypothetical protein
MMARSQVTGSTTYSGLSYATHQPGNAYTSVVRVPIELGKVLYLQGLAFVRHVGDARQRNDRFCQASVRRAGRQ